VLRVDFFDWRDTVRRQDTGMGLLVVEECK
jgi:hypothetical protein